MKRTILVLLLCAVTLLAGCGKSEAAKKVENIINDIGTVSLDSKEAIERAEKYYAALTDDQKHEVDNYFNLVEAREEYDKLVEESKKTIEVTPENFMELFTVDLYCTDLQEGARHPILGYYASSVNVHVEVTPVHPGSECNNVQVTLKVVDSSISMNTPSFSLGEMSLALDENGKASRVGLAKTPDASWAPGSTPEMKVWEIVSASGSVSYFE